MATLRWKKRSVDYVFQSWEVNPFSWSRRSMITDRVQITNQSKSTTNTSWEWTLNATNICKMHFLSFTFELCVFSGAEAVWKRKLPLAQLARVFSGHLVRRYNQHLVVVVVAGGAKRFKQSEFSFRGRCVPLLSIHLNKTKTPDWQQHCHCMVENWNSTLLFNHIHPFDREI